MNNVHGKVFNQHVWGIYCREMDACLTAGANFAATTITFNVIDLCSSYHLGYGAKSQDVAQFMAEYFDAPLSGSVYLCEKFYEVFRHGMSHQFTPKGFGAGTSKTNTLFYKFKNQENRIRTRYKAVLRNNQNSS